MKKKRQYPIIPNVLITDYAAEGKSIGKLDGKIVFVEKSVPGDIIDVQVIKDKKEWLEGFPKKIVEPSPERIAALCIHFGTCGGCQWQNLAYERQVFYKQQQVKDQLKRMGKIEVEAAFPIVAAEKHFLYRNKVEYSFAPLEFIPYNSPRLKTIEEEKPFGHFAGFHSKGRFDKVVNIEKCFLQQEPTNEIRNAVVAYCIEQELPFYDLKTHIGWVRSMIVRISTLQEVMIILIFAYEDKPKIEKLLSFLMEKFPAITSLFYMINTKLNDNTFDITPNLFYGKEYITEKLEDKYFRISPKSFFQTNTYQAEKLYQITRDFAELKGNETVYDLYCGTGSIGIFLSNKIKKLVGIELIREAIADAKENALLNKVENAVFFVGDVVKLCTDDFLQEHGNPDVIILDPPRVGLAEKLVNKLLAIKAPLMVYVSCNPATQARDLSLLSALYKVTKSQAIDMFPQTYHIENVVQLKLK